MPIYLLNLIESEEDRISLAKIYEDYKKYLFAIALDISNDAEIAEEALSETFVAVITVYEKVKYYGADQLRYFLRTVLKNKTVDLLRFKSKLIEFRTDLDENIPVEDDVYFDGVDPKTLAKALMSIKEEFREILILKYVDEMEYTDIAKILNLSYEAAKKRVFRARTALKERLEIE